MSAGNLSARERTMLKFGDELIDLLRARDEVGALAIASALPAPNSAALRRNRYASAYTFVEADKAHGKPAQLLVHLRRLRHVGEFSVVLIHAIAHIKSGDLTNDAARSFGKIFFSLCSQVAATCFAPEEARSAKEDQSLSDMFGDLGAFKAQPDLMTKIADVEEEEEEDEVDSGDI
jgi:hypothetical protein